MAYTAIVLDERSHWLARNRARGLGIIGENWREIAHHVTLAMGDQSKNVKIGRERRLVATHYGVTAGRVCAFRVKGAEDSVNEFPHVTVAVSSEAKPVESNAIAEWKELGPEATFPLVGRVQVC